MRIGTLAIICAGLLCAGCASTSGPGKPAPDFSLPTPGGQTIGLASLKGKVVVLDFWATWCPPCKEALPHLQAMSTNPDLAQRGLAVLAVDEEEDSDAIGKFIDASHFTFTVVRDSDGSASRNYSADELPTTIIIGRDGIVQSTIVGWTPDIGHQIDEVVEQALDAPVKNGS